MSEVQIVGPFCFCRSNQFAECIQVSMDRSLCCLPPFRKFRDVDTIATQCRIHFPQSLDIVHQLVTSLNRAHVSPPENEQSPSRSRRSGYIVRCVTYFVNCVLLTVAPQTKNPADDSHGVLMSMFIPIQARFSDMVVCVSNSVRVAEAG